MITFEQLLADPPKLHQWEGAFINRWKLSDEELWFINTRTDRHSKTLETGAGCSTVLFAMLGTKHTCIVPDQALVDRITLFCQEKQIPTSNLNFIVDISERALPRLQEMEFDLALIDGRHGFPQPFLDWYYIADALKVGGYVIIDDLHLWTSETLMNFLLVEKDWKLIHESLGGAVFQKLGNNTQNSEFNVQLYTIRRSRQFTLVAKARYLCGLLRRRNFKLFSSVIKLGIRSIIYGKFGERPLMRR